MPDLAGPSLLDFVTFPRGKVGCLRGKNHKTLEYSGHKNTSLTYDLT